MTKLIFLKDLEKEDLNSLGLKCGIEIHQQLNTNKLFCDCPCEIMPNNSFDKEVQRKLRFSLSETGEVDSAALLEFKKDKFNKYKYNNKITCLVDLDEEPPRKVNPKAVSMVVRTAQMMNLTFFDKFVFMRKLIIDGSIISGFQRTALFGIGGQIKTKAGNLIEIEGINLEEDSSRTLDRQDDYTVFSLDRQGIPLIEITTGPQIKTPTEAYDVAKQIGNILRSFPETKRGLGTIRQDLNVSIIGGTRVEIKGTQNLKLIPQIVQAEMYRQKIHLSILDELKNRKINTDNFSDKKIIDITKVFSNTNSQIILDNLVEKNSKVLAIKLNGFLGILGHELQENHRFASEISDINKEHFPKIKGLFHMDELPNYGIIQEEVDKIKSTLKISENDNFILLAGEENLIENSLNNILQIIEELITSIPTVVRKVDPKGTLTKFLRPMPGSSRMYPETDVPEFILDNTYFEEQSKNIPELYDEKLDRLQKDLNLEIPRIEEMLSFFDENSIKSLIKISNKNASFVYNILFEVPKDIKKREKLETVDFKYSLLEEIFKLSGEDIINQKSIRDLFISLYKEKKNEVSNLKKYLEEKKLLMKKVDESVVEEKIKEILEKNKGAPFGALMGQAMGAFGGSVDGKIISSILKRLM